MAVISKPAFVLAVAALALPVSATAQTEVYYQHDHGTEVSGKAADKFFAKYSGELDAGDACFAAYQIRGMALDQRARPGVSDPDDQEWDSRLEVRQLTLNCMAGNWEWVLGKQQVTWGQGDYFRVLDVVNPLDGRENVLAYIDDFEEGRLPLTMMNATRMLDNGDIQLLLIPEVKAPRLPAVDSEFDLFAGSPVRPNWDKPDSYTAQTMSAALRYRFVAAEDWDLGLYSYYGWDGEPILLSDDEGRPELSQRRKKLAGVSVATPVAGWIVRGDLAYMPGSYVRNQQGEADQADKSSALIGFDYSYSAFTTNIQFARHWLPEKDDVDGARSDQMSFTVSQNFRADRLTLMNNTLSDSESGRTGYLNKLNLIYRLTQEVSVDTGVVQYFGHKRSQFGQFSDNSRLYFKISAQF